MKQERDSSFVAYEGHRGLCEGCLKGRNEAVPLGDVAALSMHDTCGGEDGRKGHTDGWEREPPALVTGRGGGVRGEKLRTIFRFVVTGVDGILLKGL